MSSRVPHRIEEPASPESGSRGVGMAVVPNLRETLMPFADSVPWPVVVVDEAGLVLHVNDAMRRRRAGASFRTSFPSISPRCAARRRRGSCSRNSS